MGDNQIFTVIDYTAFFLKFATKNCGFFITFLYLVPLFSQATFGMPPLPSSYLYTMHLPYLAPPPPPSIIF